jgi:hypothetical protein
VTRRLAAHELSVSRLIQTPIDTGAALHVVLHEAPQGQVSAALAEIVQLPEVHAPPFVLPVISDRGVAGLGWA